MKKLENTFAAALAAISTFSLAILALVPDVPSVAVELPHTAPLVIAAIF